MDSTAIQTEREVLDHQRDRIQTILEHKIVSTEMESHLRVRLDYISQRLSELSTPASTAGMPPAPGNWPAAFS